VEVQCRAMVLAAGFGERLRPITNQTPKPLIPVINCPIIEHNLSLLAKAGVRDVVINLHHLGDRIKKALGDGSQFGLVLHFLHEETILGTGGGIRNAANILAGGPIVVINGDILIDIDLRDVIAFHHTEQAFATMVLKQPFVSKLYQPVEFDERQIIHRVAGKPEGEASPRLQEAIFTGVHVFDPEVLEYIPPKIYLCINSEIYPKLIRSGKKISAYLLDQERYWVDIGTVERFFAANMEIMANKRSFEQIDPLRHYASGGVKTTGLLARLGDEIKLATNVQLVPPFAIGHRCNIKSGTQIGPFAIIGDDCVVGKNSHVSNSIVWRGTKLSDETQLKSAISFAAKDGNGVIYVDRTNAVTSSSPE